MLYEPTLVEGRKKSQKVLLVRTASRPRNGIGVASRGGIRKL